MNDEPIKTEVKRNPDGTFADGTTPGPGRPRGKTMKEYAREYLMNLTDEEKKDWLKSVGFETIWKMAEGNPHQTEDITSDGEKIVPIYGSLSGHNGNKENIQPQQENKGS